MKTEALLKSMLSDLLGDLRDPGIIWQILVVVLCVLIARWAAGRTVARWEQLRAEADRRAQAAEAERIARLAAEQAALDAADQAAGRAAAPVAAGAAGVQAAVAADGALRAARAGRPGTLQAHEALSRILVPVYVLLAVLVCRPIMGHFQSVHLLNLAVVLALAGAAVRAVVYVISTVSRSPVLVAFEKALVFIVWTAVGLYVTGLAEDAVALLSSIQFSVGAQTLNVWTVLSSVFWLMIMILGAVWAGGLVQGRLINATSLDPSLRAVLSRLIQSVFLVVAVLMGFSMVGIDLTALSVFGGALGVGVGLGLQRIASNYISGFIVLLERQIRLGDQIRIEGVLQGTVRGIRTRFSLVEAGNGALHILPNETLTTSVVQNLSRPGVIRSTLPLRIHQDSDLDVATRLALQVATEHPLVLDSPKPSVALTNFSADGISLDLSFSVADPSKAPGNVTSEIGRKVLASFREAGVALPVPRREIRVLSDTDGLADGQISGQMAGKSPQLSPDSSKKHL